MSSSTSAISASIANMLVKVAAFPMPTPAESARIGAIGAPSYENAKRPRVQTILIGAPIKIVAFFDVLVIIGPNTSMPSS